MFVFVDFHKPGGHHPGGSIRGDGEHSGDHHHAWRPLSQLGAAPMESIRGEYVSYFVDVGGNPEFGRSMYQKEIPNYRPTYYTHAHTGHDRYPAP